MNSRTTGSASGGSGPLANRKADPCSLQNKNFLALPLLVAPLLFLACGTAPPPPPAASRIVTVQVSLADGAKAPQNAELSIRVVEMSGPDRAVAGSISVPGFVPGVEHKIECKASRIRETQSYGLEVALVESGSAIYRNKTPYYVLTRGNPDRVSVVLDKLP